MHTLQLPQHKVQARVIQSCMHFNLRLTIRDTDLQPTLHRIRQKLWSGDIPVVMARHSADEAAELRLLQTTRQRSSAHHHAAGTRAPAGCQPTQTTRQTAPQAHGPTPGRLLVLCCVTLPATSPHTHCAPDAPGCTGDDHISPLQPPPAAPAPLQLCRSSWTRSSATCTSSLAPWPAACSQAPSPAGLPKATGPHHLAGTACSGGRSPPEAGRGPAGGHCVLPGWLLCCWSLGKAAGTPDIATECRPTCDGVGPGQGHQAEARPRSADVSRPGWQK